MNIKNFAVGVIAVLALVLSAFGLLKTDPQVVPTPSPSPESSDLGAMIETVQKWFTKGVRIGDGNTSSVRSSFEGTIKGTSNQAAVRNTTGRTIYVQPFAAMINNASGVGVASSTFAVYMASSTAATLSSDYVMPANAFVAGVIATTTRVHDVASTLGATSSPAFPIPDGAYINIQIQSVYDCGTDRTGTDINVHPCDTATSTNRGFDLYYQIPFSYSPN